MCRVLYLINFYHRLGQIRFFIILTNNSIRSPSEMFDSKDLSISVQSQTSVILHHIAWIGNFNVHVFFFLMCQADSKYRRMQWNAGQKHQRTTIKSRSTTKTSDITLYCMLPGWCFGASLCQVCTSLTSAIHSVPFKSVLYLLLQWIKGNPWEAPSGKIQSINVTVSVTHGTSFKS